MHSWNPSPKITTVAEGDDGDGSPTTGGDGRGGSPSDGSSPRTARSQRIPNSVMDRDYNLNTDLQLIQHDRIDDTYTSRSGGQLGEELGRSSGGGKKGKRGGGIIKGNKGMGVAK